MRLSFIHVKELSISSFQCSSVFATLILSSTCVCLNFLIIAVDTPKTKNGVRQLPMTENAYQAFVRINRRRKKKTITVDGYTGFLFLNRNGLPKTSGNYESMVRGLIKKYNKTHSKSEQLPAVTPHSFRHTYCTNMANKGMNPNTLQYVMGHANITMTLGYYAHGSFESSRAEIQRLVA